MLTVFGVAILIGLIFQLVTGYALKPRSSEFIDREKHRTQYGIAVALQVAYAAMLVELDFIFR